MEYAGVYDVERRVIEYNPNTSVRWRFLDHPHGLKVLSITQESDASEAVIFLTAVPAIEPAEESMRQGAFDFIAKPFNPEVVRATVRRADERTNLLRENTLLQSNRRQPSRGGHDIWKQLPDKSSTRTDRSRRPYGRNRVDRG